MDKSGFRETIIEPAVGAAAVVLSFVALISLVAGFRALVALKSDKVLLPLLGLSATMAAGGLIGAFVGEESSTEPRSESGLRWARVTALIMLGMFFMMIMFLAMLMVRSKGPHMDTDDVTGASFAALGVAALVGAFAAQAVAPRRMSWACGFGFVLAFD